MQTALTRAIEKLAFAPLRPGQILKGEVLIVNDRCIMVRDDKDVLHTNADYSGLVEFPQNVELWNKEIIDGAVSFGLLEDDEVDAHYKKILKATAEAHRISAIDSFKHYARKAGIKLTKEQKESLED